MKTTASLKPLNAIDAVEERTATQLQTGRAVIVAGVVLGLACGFGPLFFSVVGVFLKQIAAELHWGRADVAMIPTLAFIGTAIGAPVVGYMADRIGWSRIIAFSVVLFSSSLLAFALAPANHLYLAAAGLFIGLTGAATTAAGYLAILPRVFDSRLGLALGLGMLGTGIGGFVAPIAANRLSAVMDWRQSYELLALVALIAGLLAHRMIFRNLGSNRGGLRIAKTLNPDTVPEEPGLTLAQALRTYRFWLISVVGFLVSCSILGGIVHLAAFASDKGLGPDIGAQAVGLVGLGLAISRVGVGFILDRIFAPLVGLLAFAFGAAGFFLLVSGLAAVPAYLLLAAVLLGVSTGTEGDLIPFWTRKYFGKKALGAIYGALFGVATLGAASGPFIYGLAFDHFKSYAQIHQISGLLCAACAVVILFLGRYPEAYSAARRG